MKKYVPYLGIAAALLLGGLIVVLSEKLVANRPLPQRVEVVTRPAATTTPLKEVGPAAARKGASRSEVPLAVVEERMRGAVVNILCLVPEDSGLHSITGSGIMIDPDGVILTNAHIGQYFLLQNLGVTCTVRTGSPATTRYEADLLYISPLWIVENQAVLRTAQPMGTGEYDYALLAVTGSATSEPLPSSFPYITLGTSAPDRATPVVIASYGAQDLGTGDINHSLFPTVVRGSVKNVYTFGTDTVDVLDLGGSAAAQEGSSGGGAADGSGYLVATLTTSTIDGTPESRHLGSITAPYIRRAYRAETGESLDTLLAQSPAEALAEFAYRIPVLQSIITAQLR